MFCIGCDRIPRGRRSKGDDGDGPCSITKIQKTTLPGVEREDTCGLAYALGVDKTDRVHFVNGNPVLGISPLKRLLAWSEAFKPTNEVWLSQLEEAIRKDLGGGHGARGAVKQRLVVHGNSR